MLVPDAIVRQFYVAGSLRNTADGWALDARNPMGSGTIVGVGPLLVDGQAVDLAAITASVVSGIPPAPPDPAGADPAALEPAQPIAAGDIDRFRPLRFGRGDQLTLHVAGDPLGAGDHALDLTLIELNLGGLRLRIGDEVAG